MKAKHDGTFTSNPEKHFNLLLNPPLPPLSQLPLSNDPEVDKRKFWRQICLGIGVGVLGGESVVGNIIRVRGINCMDSARAFGFDFGC